MNRTLLITLAAGAWLAAAPPEPPKPAAPAAPEAQQDAAAIKATPYNPTVKRDPFSTPREERPADGLDLIDDISVKGMIRKEGKNYAVVSDSRGNIRWLPVGHRFRDGEISAVTDKTVVFHQWEANTTNRSIFRTVTKTFKREEGKP